jgi:hypothetical protein
MCTVACSNRRRCLHNREVSQFNDVLTFLNRVRIKSSPAVFVAAFQNPHLDASDDPRLSEQLRILGQQSQLQIFAI